MADRKPGDAASLARYVVKRAPRYHLDPAAVIVVAIQEGISGKVGDNGTSFGPWQLHQGGAYPASAPQAPAAANQWAWSDAGVDYALGRMSSVAAGQQGRQAVHSIVYKFERPSDPAAEYAAAVQALPANDGGPKDNGTSILGLVGRLGSDIPVVGPVVSVGAGAVSAAGGVVSSAEAVGSFLGDLTNPHFWLRALEVVGGLIILMVGVYLLARQVGLAPSVTETAKTAALATPQGRSLAVAGGAAGAVKAGAGG